MTQNFRPKLLKVKERRSSSSGSLLYVFIFPFFNSFQGGLVGNSFSIPRNHDYENLKNVFAKPEVVKHFRNVIWQRGSSSSKANRMKSKMNYRIFIHKNPKA